jgi:integrase
VPAKRRRRLEAVGDSYDVGAYRHAIERACDRAFPAPKDLSAAEKRTGRRDHRWTPHRLRHLAGETVRASFGLDGVQAHLGHRNARVSEVYAELSTAKAVEIARKLG